MEMKNPRLPLHVRTNLLLSPIAAIPSLYNGIRGTPLSRKSNGIPAKFLFKHRRYFTDPLQQVCFSPAYVTNWINTEVFGIPDLDLLLLPLKEEC